MAKAQDFTSAMKDFMGAFPVDTKNMEDMFRSQAELGEVLRQVRLCAGLRLHVEGWRYVAREVLAQLAVVGMLSPTFELTEAGRMALLKRRPQRRTSLKIMTGAWLPGAAWSAMTRAAE